MTPGREILRLPCLGVAAVSLLVPLLGCVQPASPFENPPPPAAPKAPPPVPPAKSKSANAKAQVFAGKVVTVDAPADKSGEKRMALKGEDGTTYPLVADDVSRMFRLYPQLRDRPVKITGQLLPETKDLKVQVVETTKDGKPHVVDFWCEICQISHQQPGACVCCGDDLELREKPAP